MSSNEWHDRSFLIEFKPRAEFANLFVDCPPPSASSATRNDTNSVTDSAGGSAVGKNGNDSATSDSPPATAEMVKVSSHVLELRRSDEAHQGCFAARIADLVMHPETICGLNWGDHHRLFMCKLHVETENGVNLGPKTFHRLANDIANAVCLDEYADEARGSALSIQCASCQLTLYGAETDHPIGVVVLPEDDWLDVSPNMEFYCRDSCSSHQHLHADGDHAHAGQDASSGDPRSRWLPGEDRICLANSYTLVTKASTISNTVVSNEMALRVLRCARCDDEVGRSLKGNADIYQLHHSMTNLITASAGANSYMSTRFGTLERYFAWLMLSKCESESSLKVIIRSFDRRPHLLIWLLESYVVLTNGDLHDASSMLPPASPSDLCNGNSSFTPPGGASSSPPAESSSSARKSGDFDGVAEDRSVHSFPALKMLYKVFDATTAASDPRANGQDASVSLVELPTGACLQLTEILLHSSHTLPPACRSLGQFFIGFLKLKDSLM